MRSAQRVLSRGNWAAASKSRIFSLFLIYLTMSSHHPCLVFLLHHLPLLQSKCSSLAKPFLFPVNILFHSFHSPGRKKLLIIHLPSVQSLLLTKKMSTHLMFLSSPFSLQSMIDTYTTHSALCVCSPLVLESPPTMLSAFKRRLRMPSPEEEESLPEIRKKARPERRIRPIRRVSHCKNSFSI